MGKSASKLLIGIHKRVQAIYKDIRKLGIKNIKYKGLLSTQSSHDSNKIILKNYQFSQKYLSLFQIAQP
jgi:hypothetical protein